MATRECKEGHKYSSTESPQSESFSFLAASVFTLYHTNKREREKERFFHLTIPATVRMKRREGKRNKKGEQVERKGVEKRGRKKGSDGEPKGKGTRDGYITSRRTLCWESSGDFAGFRNWNAPTRGRTGARNTADKRRFSSSGPFIHRLE